MNIQAPCRFTVSMAAVLVSAAISAFAQDGGPAGEWPAYGSDAKNTKYSPLSAIDRSNVRRLEVAWTWQSPDVPIIRDKKLRVFSFQPTPLMIGGTLYTSTSLSQVAALDPATGSTRWIYDPKSYETGRPPNWGFVHRGLTYWADGQDRRILYGTGDGRLIALDARTGKPIASFGDKGRIDLRRDAPRIARASQFGISSPVAVCRGIVVVGSSISDIVRTKEMPPGQVRGFDVRTGEPRWTFNLIPTGGEFGNDTWENDSWKYTGNANVWSAMAVDEALGYVYLPGSTPTNDWYGGHRLGDGLFAESLICLNAETGERVWHFQAIHHGLWDYDLPAAPILVDIVVEGKPVAAVVQISKQGFCYVFDRATGEPVWPIEERPVPQSRVPGEASSPTQPFPTRPPPFERQGISVEDLIDFTPGLREQALEIVKPYRLGPLFTPPSLQGTIQLPGSSGGANWGGAAWDPETHLLYIPSITSPIVTKLEKPDATRSNLAYVRGAPSRIDGPEGLPLLKPPYGRITAIDLDRGEHVWQVANGDGPRDHPLLKDLDLPPLGQVGRAGPLLTRTLLFVADGTTATNSAGRDGGSPKFRAYDKATGEVVWEFNLPANATGTPMTYRYGGDQYILVAVMSDQYPQSLVALRLREE